MTEIGRHRGEARTVVEGRACGVRASGQSTWKKERTTLTLRGRKGFLAVDEAMIVTTGCSKLIKLESVVLMLFTTDLKQVWSNHVRGALLYTRNTPKEIEIRSKVVIPSGVRTIGRVKLSASRRVWPKFRGRHRGTKTEQ